MPLQKLGSTKATDQVLVTSVDLSGSQVTSTLPITKVGSISTSKLLGRYSSGSGVVEEITISTGLSLDGSGNLTATASGSGDVTGPASATDNAIVRFDGTTGKAIQNSVVTIADTTGHMTGVGNLTFTGVLTGGSGPTTITDSTGLILAAALNTVTVAKGGTGLTAGTSGGILGFTASGTLASSVALTANALILGGGAGATPTPLGSLGTTSTVLHGNASGAPTFGQIVAADIADAVADLFAKIVAGSPGTESSNAIEVQFTAQDLQGNTLAAATTEVTVVVTDGSADSEPSATATLSAADTPVGTLLAGGGTATAKFRTNSSGVFTVKVTETSAADRFLHISIGANSRGIVFAGQAPVSLTFA